MNAPRNPIARKLVAVFATDRLEHMKSWFAADVARAGTPLVLGIQQTTSEWHATEGPAPAVVVQGLAHHVMRAIGIVADQGEDFLVSVTAA